MKTLKNEQEQKVKHLTQIITFITKTHITPQAEKQGLPTYRIVTPRFSQHINCSSLSSEQLFTSLLHTSLCLHSLLSPFWMTKWQCVLWLVWINEFVGQLVHVAATLFQVMTADAILRWVLLWIFLEPHCRFPWNKKNLTYLQFELFI